MNLREQEPYDSSAKTNVEFPKRRPARGRRDAMVWKPARTPRPLDTVKALLKAGANPNDCCWGMLARAVIRGDENIVRELVEHGAQPTILFWGDEPLLDAGRHKSSPAIVKLLEDSEHHRVAIRSRRAEP